MFPRIISVGRQWFKKTSGVVHGNNGTAPELVKDDDPIPTSPAQFEVPVGSNAGDEPVVPPPRDPTSEVDPSHICAFDLFFLRWSLIVDGALTTVAAFATQKWHIYLGLSPPWYHDCMSL